MTLGDFRTIVKAYSQVEGQSYLELDADIDTLINEKLREFARRTLCLFTPSQAFALQSGVASYYYEGSTDPIVASGAVEFARIAHVVLNGQVLYDYFGCPGPSSFDLLLREDPNYMAATAGTPSRWFAMNSEGNESSNELYLYPAPSAAFLTTSSGKNFVAGWRLPVAVADDADLIDLPQSIQRVAAKYVAAELIHPFASGASLTKYERLMSEAEKRMEMLRAEADRVFMPPAVRRPRNRTNRMWYW